ncbi:MAG: 3-hydroxyisobutyrate dehydrogenase [Bermanella sp.]|jgi:3-hydroxyisobutyrate dehydrogenase
MTIATGYIGLGNIGKPMCTNLVKNQGKNGLQVYVYDVMPDPIQEMVALGALAANSGREIAEKCALIGLCVRNDGDVENLFYGDNGMLANAAKGTIIAIHSTVTRDNIIRWANDAAKYDIHVIDAPITGGASGAADGSLCIMVGGEDSVIERATPMFTGTSKVVVHAGELGAGAVLKLANNMITYAAFTACSEAIALMKNAGLEPDRLYEVGKANGVITPSGQQFISGREALLAGCTAEQMDEFFGPFAGLGEKDLDHALNLASQLNIALPVTEKIREGIRKTFTEGVMPTSNGSDQGE